MTTKEDDWILTWVGKYLHVMPRGDSEAHLYSSKCSCFPTKLKDDDRVIHNGFDGRDDYEQRLG